MGTEDDDRALLRTVAAKVDMLNSQFDRVALALERLVAVEVHLQGMNSRIGRVEDEASKQRDEAHKLRDEMAAQRQTGAVHSLFIGWLPNLTWAALGLLSAILLKKIGVI